MQVFSFKLFSLFFRKERGKRSDDKVDSLQEKLAVATVTLQQAIGGVTSQLADHNEKVWGAKLTVDMSVLGLT